MRLVATTLQDLNMKDKLRVAGVMKNKLRVAGVMKNELRAQ